MIEDDNFESDAKQYLDKVGNYQLNIINNILKLVNDVHEKNNVSYTKHIEDFRVIVSFKIKFLNYGVLTSDEMRILNEISLEYTELLK